MRQKTERQSLLIIFTILFAVGVLWTWIGGRIRMQGLALAAIGAVALVTLLWKRHKDS
jgi:TM2 domain-containing membrane protein YozV